MDLLQIIITVGALSILILVGVELIKGSSQNKDQNSQVDESPTYTQEELDNIKLAEELYNKDLRSEPTLTEVKTEFPIEKPKKKRKYYPRKPKTQS